LAGTEAAHNTNLPNMAVKAGMERTGEPAVKREHIHFLKKSILPFAAGALLFTGSWMLQGAGNAPDAETESKVSSPVINPGIVDPKQKDALRIVDINVWSGLDYSGIFLMGEYESEEEREKRFQLLVKSVLELDVDILTIHEANMLPDYVERLASELKMEHFAHVGVAGIRIGSVGIPWNLREGDAILAKPSLQMKPLGRKQLSGGPVGNFFSFNTDDATQVLGASLTWKGIPFVVYTTHWHFSVPPDEPYIERARELAANGKITSAEFDAWLGQAQEGLVWRQQEVTASLEWMEASASLPVVLTGDMNSTSEQPEIKRLVLDGYIDSWASMNQEDEKESAQTTDDLPASGSKRVAGATWSPTNLNHIRYYHPAWKEESDPLRNVEHFFEEKDLRVDYIFYKNPAENTQMKDASSPASASNVSSIPARLELLQSRVVLDQPVEGVQVSDHYGVLADFRLLPAQGSNSPGNSPK
jgi:endonuclease/exonuclease/phosphatase family metal-dependent hydrolase